MHGSKESDQSSPTSMDPPADGEAGEAAPKNEISVLSLSQSISGVGGSPSSPWYYPGTGQPGPGLHIQEVPALSAELKDSTDELSLVYPDETAGPGLVLIQPTAIGNNSIVSPSEAPVDDSTYFEVKPVQEGSPRPVQEGSPPSPKTQKISKKILRQPTFEPNTAFKYRAKRSSLVHDASFCFGGSSSSSCAGTIPEVHEESLPPEKNFKKRLSATSQTVTHDSDIHSPGHGTDPESQSVGVRGHGEVDGASAGASGALSRLFSRWINLSSSSDHDAGRETSDSLQSRSMSLSSPATAAAPGPTSKRVRGLKIYLEQQQKQNSFVQKLFYGLNWTDPAWAGFTASSRIYLQLFSMGFPYLLTILSSVLNVPPGYPNCREMREMKPMDNDSTVTIRNPEDNDNSSCTSEYIFHLIPAIGSTIPIVAYVTLANPELFLHKAYHIFWICRFSVPLFLINLGLLNWSILGTATESCVYHVLFGRVIIPAVILPFLEITRIFLEYGDFWKPWKMMNDYGPDGKVMTPRGMMFREEAMELLYGGGNTNHGNHGLYSPRHTTNRTRSSKETNIEFIRDWCTGILMSRMEVEMLNEENCAEEDGKESPKTQSLSPMASEQLNSNGTNGTLSTNTLNGASAARQLRRNLGDIYVNSDFSKHPVPVPPNLLPTPDSSFRPSTGSLRTLRRPGLHRLFETALGAFALPTACLSITAFTLIDAVYILPGKLGPLDDHTQIKSYIQSFRPIIFVAVRKGLYLFYCVPRHLNFGALISF